VFDRQPTPAILGYPGQLSQVFGNLVRNAAEASRPDTDVVVRVRGVHRGGKEGTRVTIHDYGSGIPENVQRLMFDPFFTTKELRGSGLGLWVSKNLVVNHKGAIRFRSSTKPEASGTTFEVFLPSEGLTPESYEDQNA
jgi:signal transduction histidine kinase